jgi:predicted kinase
MSQTVLVLTGPPGSGKTTVARLIAASATRGVHIESDVFFHFVGGGFVEPWLPESHPQNVVVMRAVAAAAARYADGGYVTVVDGIISPKWFMRPLKDALAADGHVMAYAILRPTLSVCIARASARDGELLSNPDVIAQLYDDFVGLEALESHVIDTNCGSPEEVCQTVLTRIQTGALSL